MPRKVHAARMPNTAKLKGTLGYFELSPVREPVSTKKSPSSPLAVEIGWEGDRKCRHFTMTHLTDWFKLPRLPYFDMLVDDISGSDRTVRIEVNSDISIHNSKSLSHGTPVANDKDDTEEADKTGDPHIASDTEISTPDMAGERWKGRVLDIRGEFIPGSGKKKLKLFGLIVAYYQRPEDLRDRNNELCAKLASAMETNELLPSTQL
ncbi:Hypothetical protein D9617_124g063440 [Elsinoe fawcettii]|nr:Hypothetical protein D9617_124g063440 [Elsinoe fawcettii]